jgi:hypothetical protein
VEGISAGRLARTSWLIYEEEVMKPMQIELAFVLSLADLFLFGIVVLFAFVGFVRGVLFIHRCNSSL